MKIPVPPERIVSIDASKPDEIGLTINIDGTISGVIAKADERGMMEIAPSEFVHIDEMRRALEEFQAGRDGNVSVDRGQYFRETLSEMESLGTARDGPPLDQFGNRLDIGGAKR